MFNDISSIPYWQIFSIIGVLLMACEIFVPGFVLLPIGLSFLLTGGVALLTTNVPILFLSLGVFLVLVFWVFKKFLKPFHGKTRAYTNAEGMVGSEAIVIEEIPLGGTGYVKLYGDQWQAKSFASSPLKTGARVVIVKLDGNKVVVEPMN